MLIKIVSKCYLSLFYSIILASPLVIYGISFGGFSMRISRLLIILIIPFLIAKILTKPNLILRDNFLLLGIIPYLIYTTISILWSPNVETGTGSQRLGGLFEVILLYIIFNVADLTPEKFQKFTLFYCFSTILPIYISIWQLVNNFLHFSQSEVPFEYLLIEGKYDLLEGRVFLAAEGFSRISSSFAEPTIFGCFACSVLLLSLNIDVKKRMTLYFVRLIQFLTFLILQFC